jgi:hypothetical protein
MQVASKTLIQKIQTFIRRYYFNRLIKGILLGIGLLASLVLLLHSLEFYLWLPTGGRKVLFGIYLIGALFIIVNYILLPAFRLFTYRKQMSAAEAARLIGKHFTEIQDRLLNTLQLQESAAVRPDPLLEAAIEQRTERLAVYQFGQAVSLRPSKKILIPSAVVLAIFMLLFFWNPEIISKSGERIVRYNQTFLKPLPFSVVLPEQSSLNTLQNVDFQFDIKVIGEELPSEFYIQIQGGRQLMRKISATEFSYVFKKPGRNLSFTVEGGDYTSSIMTLEVFPKAVILAYEAMVYPPAYTQLESFSVSEKTGFYVPEGSKVLLDFYTRDTDSLFLAWNDSTYILPNRVENNSWSFDLQIKQTLNLTAKSINSYANSSDSFPLDIDLIKDAFPDIVGELVTEEPGRQFYFSGAIADDYGFNRLAFIYEIVDPDTDEKSKPFYIDLNLQNSLRQNFFFLFDADTFNLHPGDRVEAFFKVWDNDAVNGPKSSKTVSFNLEIPGREMLDSISDSRENELLERMENAVTNADQIREELEKLLQDLATKKQVEWTDKQKLDELFERQKSLEKEFLELQDEQEKQIAFEEENQLTDEKLLQKQEEIKELFDEVFSDEMKAVMEEIQKLMEELNKDQMQKMIEDLKQDSKKMEELLDRNLNLLQQLKMEKEMTDLIESLESLGEELSKKKDDKEEQKSMSEAKEEFEDIQKKLDTLQNRNSQLDNPLKFDDTDAIEEEINQDLDQGIQEEQNQKMEESGGSQQKAGEKMKEMANMLQMAMQAGIMQQQMEDAHTLRILLENVVKSSVDQEELMRSFSEMLADDPKRPELIRKQNELVLNFSIVEDSLRALANRQPMIETFIFDELKSVEFRIEEALGLLKDGRLSQGVSQQQFAFMSMNNLALMLAESLQNMQNSMGMPSPMNAQGQPKPGQQSSGKQQMQQMRQMQEALGKALEEMRKQQGEKSGGKPDRSQSEQLARMAAEQEAIRKQMQNYLNGLKSEGRLDEEGINEMIQEMEKLEEQLVNKSINRQLIERQKEIVSRMLESEKSEEKREKEEKRESNEFKGNNYSNQLDEPTYKRHEKEQIDLLRLQSIELKPFYKERSNAYFFKRQQK